MSYQIILVIVDIFGSVLYVILRMKQIVLILFQGQNFNLCIGNMAVMYKGQIKLTCNSTVKNIYIVPYNLHRNVNFIFLSVAAHMWQIT